MAPASPKTQIPWIALSWFGLLIAVCNGPVLYSLVFVWANDEDMGHGFFVPLISAFIIWQNREELLAFPLLLLFFMVPIPAIIYNRITFPLQLIASRLAAGALDLQLRVFANDF